MTSCDLFERKSLLALEQGQEIGPHIDTCPDCQRARAEYDSLTHMVQGLGADARPEQGWQDEVFARIRRRAARRWRWRPAFAVPLAAAAVVAALLIIRPPESTAPAPPMIAAEIRPGSGGAIMRGTSAQPGDVLVLRASTGSSAHAELRVYLADRILLLSCSDAPPCRRVGDALGAEFILGAMGTYQPALFLSGEPLPAGGLGLDADAGVILQTGGRVELSDPIDVR